MRVLIVLSVCVALACAASPPRSAPEAGVEVKARTKRDYPVDSSYSAPSSYGYGNGGVYYYYYPSGATLQEKGEKDEEEKDKCDVERLLAPIILITIFLGIIAGAIVGLFPALTLPTVQQILALLPQINGRSMDDMTVMITQAVESEDCLDRLFCESGKFADGYTNTVSMFEFFAPRAFESKMKIFKDSALRKTDCKRYRCSYVDFMFK
ncbi:uncharacterized protein [Penaeus vannamei]|uniref:uncharacterized protein n=1 Tax=Penaeus vannamei TaxID=6689 RepID=UPI000F66BB59|nr:uncharacterized protein LOC113817891 [Penaeus vannamei]